MACEHKHLRCTDGIFYCLDCGARVDIPVYKTEHTEENKKPTRKTAKKGAPTK